MKIEIKEIDPAPPAATLVSGYAVVYKNMTIWAIFAGTGNNGADKEAREDAFREACEYVEANSFRDDLRVMEYSE
jgi:hypothetical protein